MITQNYKTETIMKNCKNLEQTLNLWKMRDLSLIGRILIAKTFGISKFLYISSIIELETDTISKIETILYNFIWQGNRAKIKKSVLVSDYCYGGLRAPDLKSIIKAQKMFWIKRYIDNTEPIWKLIINSYLKPFGGTLLAYCNYEGNNNNHLPTFYRECFKEWRFFWIW